LVVEDGELYRTAYHEAGHAVAAVMRGGTFFSISIEPTTMHDGTTHIECERCHTEFVTYAGPWAEARAEWPDLPLDALDADGRSFDRYVEDALLSNPSDLRQYEPSEDIAFAHLTAELWGGEPPPVPAARDLSWFSELESGWSAMKTVAEMLVSGIEITADGVRGLLAYGVITDGRPHD
jgi:hypothetical protein